MSERGAFSGWRAYLWPIHSHELRKFLPLLCMAFFIGFNYNILRNMKDALLITAKSSGAEVLPFIKVWGIIPGAFLMTMIYGRLNNRLGREKVFYAMVSIFIAFFALFAFIFYPLRDSLHLDSFANALEEVLPLGFKGLIAMIRYWSFSGFYILSELWSSTILSMLFWGFANEITRLGEAKRFYSLIALGLNVAAISSGQVSVFLCSGEWERSFVLQTTVVLISGIAILGIYRYMTQKVLVETDNGATVSTLKTPPIRLSMRENFAYLSRSKYLLYLAIIVLSYNVVINLVEVIWKDQVRQLYPLPGDYNSYMSQITTITGVISFFMSLLISGQMIRRCGWTFTALATPMILLLTSIGFFLFFFGKGSLSGILYAIGTSPLTLVVFFGSTQNCLCRAAKFTLFDGTKEMAFIPLDRESKLKGKAVIDGVGSRLGKSGGSLIHQGLLILFSTIAASAHIVAIFLFAVIAIWTSAVLALGKQFHKLAATPADEVPEPAPLPVESEKPVLTQ